MAKGNFQCSLCLQDFTNNEIETALCNHIFCIQCLDDYITENLNFLIKCPVSSCSHNINDNIIRKIIDDDHVDEYDQIIRRNIKNSHCCILPECSYYILYDNKDFQFECPFCTLYNCIKCQAAHMSLECYQYQSSSAVVQENVCKCSPAELLFGRHSYRESWWVTEETKQDLEKYKTVQTRRRGEDEEDEVLVEVDSRDKNQDRFEEPFKVINKIHEIRHVGKEKDGKQLTRNIET